VLVQEDFFYHDLLTAEITHPHRSKPMLAEPTLTELGDGLNRFSRMRFDPVVRETWQRCNGSVDCSSDCMTDKGFSVARVYLARGVSLNVYNLHMDAGDCDGDFETREAKNWKNPQDQVMLDQLLLETGVAIACNVLACTDGKHDRIMFRSSPDLKLTPTSWSNPAEFVNPEGFNLSDHKPVLVEFSWEKP
jgi:hypothetical protein